MSRRILIIAVVVIAIGLAVWLWTDTGTAPQPSERLTVAATIFPVADIAQNIGGDLVEVITLVPPGASPHSYQLTPAQAAQLQASEIVFAIGVGLDDALVEAATKVAEAQVMTLEKGITLREFGGEHGHGGALDPHYWLSVPNAIVMAQNVTAHLTVLDPDQAGVYRANLETYIDELERLEQELQIQAAELDNKNFVAMHDAWSYFAEQYGLNLAATYEPVEGRQPSAADLRRLQTLVEQFAIPTFFVEPQKRSSAAVQFLERELGVKVGSLDPVGGRAGDSYIELMRRNAAAIVRGQ